LPGGGKGERYQAASDSSEKGSLRGRDLSQIMRRGGKEIVKTRPGNSEKGTGEESAVLLLPEERSLGSERLVGKTGIHDLSRSDCEKEEDGNHAGPWRGEKMMEKGSVRVPVFSVHAGILSVKSKWKVNASIARRRAEKKKGKKAGREEIRPS